MIIYLNIFNDSKLTTFLELTKATFGLIVKFLKICFKMQSTYIASTFFSFCRDNKEI